MKRIGVFCFSRGVLRQEFIDAGRELGTEIGKRGAEMVYGGSKCGLMDITAQAVRSAGGRTVGVMPQVLLDKGLEADADLVFYTANLDDRKATMLREADVFVALPGGIGTLDEIFTVVAANTLGYHNKTTILYNVCGFWQPLIDALKKIDAEKMMDSRWGERLKAISTPEELYEMIF